MQMMNIKDFKAGTWKKQYEYKSFIPNTITHQWIISDPEILSLLGKADRSIGRLDAYSDLIPDIDFFIKMHITKEATLSNKIEGTQTSFQDALIKQDDITADKKDDWKEIHNYISAMKQAVEDLQQLPISNRLICKTHRLLLLGTRGDKKYPGSYRTSQNWIGQSLSNASFVPPHHEEIGNLMQDLEKFINTEILDKGISIPHLIKMAIMHYQFETIHPFLDGNGRIGRLLITLYLIDKKSIK